ncbi:MAG: hypothetical protein ACD_58C00070G0001, partial [uncultured bacterium]
MEDSVILQFEAKVAEMPDDGLKIQAEDYLYKAKTNEKECVYLAANISLKSYLTKEDLNQFRHHVGSMHSALRCVKDLISAD